MTYSSLGLVVILFLLAYIYHRYVNKSPLKSLPNKYHVIISGGSKGIGKALAIRYAELGANITIIARNKKDLESAKLQIERYRSCQKQWVHTVSLDLIKVQFPDRVSLDFTNEQQQVVDSILGDDKRCDTLINCCGQSIPAKFQDLSQQDFKFMMDVNYFAAVNLTRLVLPSMKMKSFAEFNSPNGSQIVFVSSMCGLLSFYGFSAYSAAKFALVGLAEALNMELAPFKISVTVAFPSDTKTPGYDVENTTKPALTKLMSQAGSLYNPSTVADAMVEDIRRRKFYSVLGAENMAALSLVSAFMPDTFVNAVFYGLLALPLRFFTYFQLRSWYSLVMSNLASERAS